MNFLAKIIQLLGLALLITFVAAATGLYFGLPARFHAPQGVAADSMPLYICPMHPEVEQDHPGQYPKCGIALTVASLETKVRTCGEQDSGCCVKPASTVTLLPPGHPPIECWAATEETARPDHND